MLVTGGGGFNRFLMERLRIYSPVPVTVPDRRTVEFKEALIFAFLGLLRILSNRIAWLLLRVQIRMLRRSCLFT
jgi:1,6-anhydro-N-acetylmuramate kinase